MLPTASKLQRAIICPASAVLPQINHVTEPTLRGTAIHEYLAAVGELGKEEALLRVPEEHRNACEVIDLESLPACAPESFTCEVAFAYDVVNGKAREVGRDINRAYRVGLDEIAGTADVLGVGSDAVFIGDYKSGRVAVAKATGNWQLKLLALAACRTYGLTRATVAIIQVGPDGDNWYDVAHLESNDLDQAAVDLRVLGERIHALQAKARTGVTLNTVTGDHCRRCQALAYCPGQTALIRRLAMAPDVVDWDARAALTPETAASAWERLRIVEDIAKRVRGALYAFAAEQPVPLPDGMVLGEVESRRREIDGLVAREVLAKLHGPDVADAACEFASSQVGIERALRPVAKLTGAKLAALKREAMAEIDKAGGVTTKVSRSIREHRPEVDDDPQEGDELASASPAA